MMLLLCWCTDLIYVLVSCSDTDCVVNGFDLCVVPVICSMCWYTEMMYVLV